MNLSDPHDIIESIRKEDRNALLEIYKVYYPQVRHYILQNSGNIYDTEDIFQDALVLIYMKVRNNTISFKYSFGTFLNGVVRFLWLKELERKRKYFGIELERVDIMDVSMDFLEDYIKLEEQKLIFDHFNSMSEDCKKLLSLYFDEIPISRITVIMGYTSDQYTKNRRLACKERLVRSVWNSPRFKELKNETYQQNNKVPRW